MKTYCITQGTLLNALWGPTWQGNPKKRGWVTCICIAESLCCTVETSRIFYINYAPIKINKKIGLKISPPTTSSHSKPQNLWMWHFFFLSFFFFFGKRDLYRYNCGSWNEIFPLFSKWPLNARTCPYKRYRGERHKKMRSPREDGGRDCSDAAISWGMLGSTIYQEKQGSFLP